MRTTLKELVIYLVFLIILCIGKERNEISTRLMLVETILFFISVTLSAMNPTMYLYTTILRKQFIGHESVNQVTKFWEWLETEFVDGIYNEEW